MCTRRSGPMGTRSSHSSLAEKTQLERRSQKRSCAASHGRQDSTFYSMLLKQCWRSRPDLSNLISPVQFKFWDMHFLPPIRRYFHASTSSAPWRFTAPRNDPLESSSEEAWDRLFCSPRRDIILPSFWLNTSNYHTDRHHILVNLYSVFCMSDQIQCGEYS